MESKRKLRSHGARTLALLGFSRIFLTRTDDLKMHSFGRHFFDKLLK